MKKRRWIVLAALFAGSLGLAGLSVADQKEPDPFDQSGVPIEVQPKDPSLTKIVLVAGKQSHGPGDHEFFAGCSILMKMLQQTEGVFPVMARDGWPKNPKTFEGAKAVVFYMDGGGGHPIFQKGENQKAVQELMDKGVGFVNLHYAVEYPKSKSEHIFAWLGGYYETNFSVNPHWKANFKALPDHPIARGVKPFEIQDEWYFNIRFAPASKNVTPILKATPPDNLRRNEEAKKFPGREEIVAWAFERDKGGQPEAPAGSKGGRSFGFTGGHFHRNWGDENFRRLVVNAILWTANVEVPKDGAKVELDPADLKKNLDRKGK